MAEAPRARIVSCNCGVYIVNYSLHSVAIKECLSSFETFYSRRFLGATREVYWHSMWPYKSQINLNSERDLTMEAHQQDSHYLTFNMCAWEWYMTQNLPLMTLLVKSPPTICLTDMLVIFMHLQGDFSCPPRGFSHRKSHWMDWFRNSSDDFLDSN